MRKQVCCQALLINITKFKKPQSAGNVGGKRKGDVSALTMMIRQCVENLPFQIWAAHLVCVEDLQEGFVDVRLALEAVLDLVNIVDGVVELHWLIVLNRRSGGGAAEWLVELHGRGARGGVRWDGRIALTAWCQRLRLERLWRGSQVRGSQILQLRNLHGPILGRLYYCHGSACVCRCVVFWGGGDVYGTIIAGL